MGDAVGQQRRDEPNLATTPPRQNDLQSSAERFVTAVVESWSGPAKQALTFLATSYADRVDYYGSAKARSLLLEEKQKFAARWPERNYTVRPNTLRSSCEPGSSLCMVEGVVDWISRNEKRGTQSSGAASFSYQVKATDRGFEILGERGSTLSRHVESIKSTATKNTAAKSTAAKSTATETIALSQEPSMTPSDQRDAERATAEMDRTAIAPPQGRSVAPSSQRDADQPTAKTNRTTVAPPQEPSRQLGTNDIAALLKRGEDLFRNGDLPAARVVLRRAAEANSAEAALTLAATYDPVILRELRVYGLAADVSMARSWYEKAKELGSPQASRRLEILAREAQ